MVVDTIGLSVKSVLDVFGTPHTDKLHVVERFHVVDDAKALAQNAIRLLRDADLAGQLASSAYKQSQLYRWTAVRQQWLDLYRSMKYGRAEVARELVTTKSEKLLIAPGTN